MNGGIIFIITSFIFVMILPLVAQTVGKIVQDLDDRAVKKTHRRQV